MAGNKKKLTKLGFIRVAKSREVLFPPKWFRKLEAQFVHVQHIASRRQELALKRK